LQSYQTPCVPGHVCECVQYMTVNRSWVGLPLIRKSFPAPTAHTRNDNNVHHPLKWLNVPIRGSGFLVGVCAYEYGPQPAHREVPPPITEILIEKGWDSGTHS
jgi:hypothetical protein